VELQIEAYPGKRFVGRVAHVGPAVDRVSRTFLVEVHVPNQKRRLRAGCFATAEIVVGEDHTALTVPEEAIVSFAGVTKVFVVAEGGSVAREIAVELGRGLEVGGSPAPRHWVEVKGDLPAGGLVVTSGQSQLADGVAVRVRESADER
jgi:RND family efflux transporter MFP subunit